MKRKFIKGLTLLELLIVISLIGVLIFSSVIFVPTQIKKAKDAKIKTHIHQIKMGLEDYYDSNNEFPETLPECGQPLVEDGKFYIPNIPCDPFDNSNYFYETMIDESGNWFKIYAKLRNIKDPIIEFNGCLFGCGPNCEYNYGASSTNTLIDKCPDPNPTPTGTPGPIPIKYACSPGNNRCDQYDDPFLSQCPKVYENDPTCNNECSVPANRCKNASGKYVPE